MVKILIGNLTSRILGYLEEDVNSIIDKQLSYSPPGARFSKAFKDNKWDGVIRLYKKSYGQYFNTGLMSIVEEILKENKVEYCKVDERVKPEINLPDLTFTPFEDYEERDYQQFTLDRAYKKTRGILKVATGGGKCLGKGTPILMFDGSQKFVEDIVYGDLLMGPDSNPRKVLSTNTGFGPLYFVEQKNGDDYVCNDAHILCLERTSCPSRGWVDGKLVEVTAEEFYNSSKWFKHTHKGYKVGVQFPARDIKIEPYMLGLWLGDGCSRNPNITTGDEEIKDYIYEYSKRNNLMVTINEEKGNCTTYKMVTARGLNSPLRTNLQQYGLINNKHIPDDYKFNERNVRLSLLAGLIDSDGNLKRKGSLEFCSVKLRLANDVCWLARSLGYRASCNKKTTSIKSIGYKGIAYRVAISGAITDIPLLLERKCKGDQTKYKALRYGIKIKPIGNGEYFGFEIDGDRKFLLGDFTVTHNTLILSELISRIKTAPCMFYVLTKDLMEQAYDSLSLTLNEPIGRIGGGKYDMQKINICTVQTAVRAVNLRNKKFKISDYQFDEEDVWDKKDIEDEDKLENLKNLLRATKVVFFDECITGDSIVETERGKVRIEEIKKEKCRYVLTHDGNNVMYQKIMNFWDKGYKDILKITLNNGEHIRCTTDHAILTNSGWKKAGEIKTTDQVLFVNAGAESGSNWTNTNELENMSWDIRLKKDPLTNGTRYMSNTLETLHCANADAMEELDRVLTVWKHLLNLEEPKDIQNTLMDTINNLILYCIISSPPRMKYRLFAEHVWETLRSFPHTQDPKIIDYAEGMGYVRKNGPIIKNSFCLDSGLRQKKSSITAMEKNQLFIVQDVCRFYQQLLQSCMMNETKSQMKSFWTNLGRLDSPGGSATMDLILADVYRYILKGGMNTKILSSQNGSKKMDLNVSFKKQKKMDTSCIISDLTQTLVLKFMNTSKSMSPDLCNISWKTIKSVKKEKTQNKVYDIEVENTHCFFANGILVHNCHHASAKTCQDVMSASPNAFWRYGCSATPYREDGAEIVLQSLFGRKIVDISASYLIENGFLATPHIIFDPIEDNCKLNSYQQIYKECVSGNDEFNTRVVNIAEYLIEKGLSVLILVSQYNQGDYIKALLKSPTNFVTGRMNKTLRQRSLDELREGVKRCIIGTTLFDEGIDVPRLDAVLMAGGGASATRVYQRIGRTLRLKDGKDRALAIYFHHDARYLDKHARKAKKIMKEEPAFIIKQSKGGDFIFDDIDEVYGFKSDRKNLFQSMSE